MAFEPLSAIEILSGKFAKYSMFLKIKNSLEFLYGQIGTQGGNTSIPNGSFEVDSDGDGMPDSWTKNLFPGGSARQNTSVAMDGLGCLEIIHPGGAGNGGGIVSSDYVACSPLSPEIISVLHWCDNSAMKNIISVKYYDSAKIFLSESVVYSSTLNPTNPAQLLLSFLPPANARWFKLNLCGGDSSVDAAGTAYFDGVNRQPFAFAKFSTGKGFSMSAATVSSQAWVDVASASMQVNTNIPCFVYFTAAVAGSGSTGVGNLRFRHGADYSNSISKTGSGYSAAQTIGLNISSPLGTGEETIYMQLMSDGAYESYGKVDTNTPQRQVTSVSGIFS